MSLTTNAAHSKLKKALMEADIQFSPSQVLEKTYLLSSSHGPDPCQLAGKIVSLQLTEEEGLEIFISSLYLGGQRIRSIIRAGVVWRACTEQGRPAVEFELV